MTAALKMGSPRIEHCSPLRGDLKVGLWMLLGLGRGAVRMGLGPYENRHQGTVPSQPCYDSERRRQEHGKFQPSVDNSVTLQDPV